MTRSLIPALLLALAASGARAQCTAIPVGQGPNGPSSTVVSCPSGVSVLQTDRNGMTTGQIHGEVFVGRSFGAGNAVGTLGGRPYDIQGGLAPDPSAAPAYLPPPPVILAQPSPAQDFSRPLFPVN